MIGGRINGKLRQVSIGTTATLVSSRKEDRGSLLVLNTTGTQKIYFGFSNSITATQDSIPMVAVLGAWIRFTNPDAIWAMAPDGAQTVAILEEVGSETLPEIGYPGERTVTLGAGSAAIGTVKIWDGVDTALVDSSGNLAVIAKITDGTDTALVDSSGNLAVAAISGATRTYATYSATISADTDIVSAVASKRIKVYAYSITTVSTTENTIIFKSNGTGGTELWRVDLQAPASIVVGANMSVSPGLDGAFLFATVAGQKLTADVGAAVAIHISISYWADDAT